MGLDTLEVYPFPLHIGQTFGFGYVWCMSAVTVVVAGGRGCRRKRGRRIRGSTSSRTPRTGNYEIELFLRGESRGRVSRLGVFNRTRFRVFRYVRGVCDELSAAVAVASVKKGETKLRGGR